ncbi:hypothetical protein [Dyella sp. RRB7]|uniref:hypothetical protein n=1 Tax=Dyella sp. RRB7 TaxID=2919502 RepID=UPI001FAA07CA|nr:hypothetical protein [Dyella sp. RRB7]
MQHQNGELVDARLRYLWSWPLMAWIRPSDPNAGPGLVLDVLEAEVVAAHAHPDADVLRVRDIARESLFSVGPATEAIPNHFKDWRLLRPALTDLQENARRIAAISPWRPKNINRTRIADWMGRPMRESADAARTFQSLRDNLANEVTTRGDRRIVDPTGIADRFFSEIAEDGQLIAGDTDMPPAIQILVNAGLQPNEIDPSATFAEVMNLLIFHKRLGIIAESSGLPLHQLKRTVTRNRLPVVVIEEGMRKHAHDQPERKGSELNDVHLLCLASYADVTYVDKRTLESIRRAKARDAVFATVVGIASKASSYNDIFAELIKT